MFVLLEAFAFVAALICAVLAYRAFRQYQNAKTLKIRSGNGIDEAIFVRLGGIEQWIQIRGENRSNPVLLTLHGGLALSYMALTPLFRRWEKEFVVVQWDRRGVGKTYGRNRRSGHGEMSLKQIVEDGIELTEWLKTRLQRDKIILLGHSMGSIVGVTLANRRPDLFEAYVGSEQVITMERNEATSYEMILTALRILGDEKGIAVLEIIGPPPYPNVRLWGAKQQLVKNVDPVYRHIVQRTIPALLFFSPNYTFGDIFDFINGNRFSGEQLFADWMNFDATKFGNHFEIPVFIIQGENDVMAPTTLVQQWFDRLEAPQKALELIPSTGHLTMFATPDLFLSKLVAVLRLITTRAEVGT